MLTPYLVVKGAPQAIDFYRRAFGAEELYRLTDPAGVVGHAELTIGGGKIMLADEFPDHGVVGPLSMGGSPVSIHLEVPDVDQVVARAAAAGATVVRPPSDEFYGERAAKLRDPFGHVWHVATPIEEVSPAEMQRRYERMFVKGS